VLATMVDVVGGMPPSGTMNPTVDLRVQLLSEPPSSGGLHLVCRPLKTGKRLYWAEVPIHAEGATEPFALGTVTFMSQVMSSTPRFSGRKGPGPDGSFDELVGARHLPGGASELRNHPAISNGFAGTVQGGAQVAFAEVAVEWALAERGEHRVTDVLIRYLNRLVGDTLHAAPHLHDAREAVVARVPLTDPANGGGVVSSVQAVARPVAAGKRGAR
jgi:acyl-coenzyme A thioesterase PaaI-like protein